MARRNPQLEFDAVRVEGGLITPDYLARIASLEALHQAPADYGLPRGLQVRDEIGRSWRIAEAHWRDVQVAAGSAAHIRAVSGLLREAFGWTSLTPLASAPERMGISYPITATAREGRVPVVIAEPTHDLDAGASRYGDGQRRRSPFGLLQEFLNADEASVWGIVTNGGVVRIARDNASLTRPAWVEADLARIFNEQRYADFSLLWLLLHQSRFGRGSAESNTSVLEQWRTGSLEAGTAARDRLRDGVEAALRAFGNGFLMHPANDALRDRLRDGSLSPGAYHQQLLRLVYRLIFLIVSEERGLLHPFEGDATAREAYRLGYGIQRLRERSVRRRAYDRYDDLWDSLGVVFHGLARGEARLALAGLGGLFAEGQCSDLDSARLGNKALLEGIFRLTWLAQENALLRVNWRDMGTEELGSVYESLLELVPELHDGATRFGFAGDPSPGTQDAGRTVAGNARKLTGSYYTPDSLVQALLDTALEPVIARALAAEHPERALLELSVLDPAMGSGHFLLGAARRIAGHLARVRADGTPGPETFRRALRDVIGHCVYGSDKNAMAVELARIALWLEAMEPGKPLAFVDHHLVHGDALLGALSTAVLEQGIPEAAFVARTGDDADALRTLKQANAAELRALRREREGGQYTLRFDTAGLAASLSAVDALPDGTLDEVAAKERALREARGREDARLRFACDALVAAFLLPRTAATSACVPTTGTLRNLAIGIEPSSTMQAEVRYVATETPFLHWPITFAAVMARGGFDCVVGNPPWEKVKLSEKEFFAARAPDIATAGNKAARARAIERLRNAAAGSAERRLFDQFEAAKREAEGASAFARGSGRYPLTGSGDVNLYALFAEAAVALTANNGRTGLVLPSGIASDAGTAPYFRHIADGRLVSLIDFENREALFDGVHRSTKFCLLTAGQAERAQFAFFLTNPDQRFDERRRFSLTPADLRRLNPNTGNAPVFRSRADAELTARIYERVPVLVDETREDGNPWGVSFARLFDMSTDSDLFKTAPGPGLVPLYEAKMIHHFDHRWATYTGGDEEATREVTEAEKEDLKFEVRPRYWVPKKECEDRLSAKGIGSQWLLALRLITRATDDRTIIGAVVPRVALGHSALMLVPSQASSVRAQTALLALLNSLVFDYVARQKVGGVNLSLFMLKQMPCPSHGALSKADEEFLASRAMAVTPLSAALQKWKEELERHLGDAAVQGPREVLRAELDAYCARLFGLDRDELRYVLDPQDAMGPDYPSETFRVLKDGEMRRYGEFRTRRLVLEAWDRLFGSR